MKKRILSMLMLVVMVVTALPLMALTVFAETTEPEFDAEDYNALYVQEGLVYALDFFVTNEHWENKEVTFTSKDDAMAAIPGYVWYNQDEKVTINIVWGTESVKIAGGHFDTQNLKELVLWSLAGLTNKSQAPGATADMLMQVSPGAGSMPLVFNNIRPYLKTYTEDGVTKMKLESVGVFDHTKYPPITNIKYNGQDVTLKMYSAPTSLVMTTLVPPLAASQKNTTGMDLHVGTYMRDENGEILKDENGELIISVTSTTKYYDARYIPAGPREVTTYYVDGQKQDAAQTFEKVYMAEDQNVYGDFALYEDGRLIYENKGEMPYLNNPSVSYTQTNWRLDTTIGTEPLKLDVYAARYYGRVLDANEVARNHLADLAKWFKLDLTYLHNLDKDSLIAVATDPTVTALSVSDKKEDVQKAVDAIAQAIIGEKYSDTLPEDIIAVLVGNSLDGSALLKYPKGLLPNTYSFLVDGYKRSDNVKGDYADALAADLAAIQGIGDWTDKQYDALYVERGLQFAADFFPMNTYWNPAAGEEGHVDYPALLESSGDASFLEKFVTYRASDSTMALSGEYSSSPVYDVREGYIQMKESLNTSAAFKVTNAGTLPPAKTLQLTAAMGCKLKGVPPVIFHGIYAKGTAHNATVNGTYTYNSFYNTAFTGSFASGAKGFTNSATVPASLTYSILDSDAAGADTFKVADQKEVLATATGTSPSSSSIQIGWQNSAAAMRIYAIRYYLADLTDDEREQNHFADLAKFFRLNLVGFSMLSDARKQDVYEAVLGFDFTSSREDIQETVTELVLSYISESYAALKGTDEKVNDLIDLAADYFLDVNELFASERNMSWVYKTVTDTALAGKSTSKAQEEFDDAVFDAWHYRSYEVADSADRATDFNALLAWCATNCSKDSYVDLEPLMALPYAKRLGALDAVDIGESATIEAVQKAIDGYVEGKMAEYSVSADIDYNSIYVQDGLIFAADFFDTNKYWGKDVAAELNAYVWTDTAAVFNTNTIPSGAVTGGYLLLNKVSANLGVSNTASLTNLGQNGTTGEYVGVFTTTGDFAFVLNNIQINPTFAVEEDGKRVMTVNRVSNYYSNSHMQFRTGTGELLAFSAPSPKAVNTLTFMVDAPTYTLDYYGTTLSGVEEQATSWGTTFKVTHSYDEENGLTKRDEAETRAFAGYLPVVKEIDGKKYVVDAIARDGGTANPWDGLKTNTNGGISGSANFYATEPGYFGVYVDSVEAFASNDVYFPNNKNQNVAGGNTWLKNNNKTFAADTKLHAFRQYDRVISVDEMAQNHFADLAKWFRLDVSAWFFMPDSIREKAYNAVKDYTFDSNPAEVQEAIDGVFAEYYDDLTIYTGEDAEEKNAAFRELALATWMNVDAIRALGAERREALVGGLIEAFDLNYSFNSLVFRGEYDLLTKPLTAMTFAGYQVRLDTGAPSQNYAGVRAVFDVDTALIEQLVRSTGKSVTVSAGIELGGERAATISFVFSLEGDEITYVGENRLLGATPEEDTVTPAKLYERADGITSFNYVMTYKGDEATAESFAIEYSYVYDILVDGVNNDFSVQTKTLGNTISAYEVYSLFAEKDAYKDDVVVKSVVSTTAK